MFKEMKKGLICALLVFLLPASAIYARPAVEIESPFDSAIHWLEEAYQSIYQSLAGTWTAVFEQTETDGAVEPTSQAGGEDPPPPANDDDEDGGNFGGGADPFG